MKKYQTFLVRVWALDDNAAEQASPHRFVLETVSDAPQRWRFDSFQHLVAFLGTAFGEPTPRHTSKRRKKLLKEHTDEISG